MLPIELTLAIAEHTRPDSWPTLSKIQLFHQTLHHPLFWRSQCRRLGLVGLGQQKQYRDHYVTDRNWRLGRFRRTCRPGDVCLHMDGGRAVSTGETGGWVWELESGIRVVDVGTVSAAAVDGPIVVDGTRDGILSVQDVRMRNKVCRTAHQDEVSVVSLSGGTVISGSMDGTVKLWDLGLNLLNQWTFGSPISAVAIRKGAVAIGTVNGTLFHQNEIANLNGGTINCLTICGSEVICGTDDGVLRGIRGKTHRIVEETYGSPIIALHRHRGRVVAGHADGLITCHDLRTKRSMFIAEKRQLIWQIYSDDYRIISSSIDQRLLVHDFSTIVHH
jgi:WD40 repeat protein